MLDIQTIKQRISCVDYAKRVGLPITKSGDRCVSPLRSGAKNPSSFVVYDDFWYDHGSGLGGDVIELASHYAHDGNRGAAIRDLARITGITDDTTSAAGWLEYTKHMNAQTAFYNASLTTDDRAYLYSRGLNDDDISRLMIGRVTDGPLRGRLFLPYFSGQDGYVCYSATRALPGSAFPDSKYMKQRRDDYNQHIPWGMQTLTRSNDTLIIAEGYFDAAAFEATGFPVLSAITGIFSKTQISTVISAARMFSRVFIVYDNDPGTHAGERFTERMSQLLTRHRIPFVVGTVPQPYHDISEYFAAFGNRDAQTTALQAIVNAAQDGVDYVATHAPDFDTLERFVFSISRHTPKSRMAKLLNTLKTKTDFDAESLRILFKSALAPPDDSTVADEILRAYQLVYINGVGFYEYAGGVWTFQPDGLIRQYIDRAYGSFSTAPRISSVLTILKSRALRDVTFNARPVWNFINGTLELDTGTFRDHSPHDYCSVQAQYPYNPDATYSAWAKFIDDVTDDDPKSAEILQFIPAYALFQDCPHEKIFVLTGSGGNGKSRYLEILSQLFGDDNTSHLAPRALMDKFQLIQLRHSIINIAGEIRSDLIDVEERLKSIASGEPQSACYKGEQFVTFKPRTKLVFATNAALSSGDTSEGLARRLVVVDFKMKFVDDPDPRDYYQRQRNIYILDQLQEELRSGGIFNWVYNGYKLLRTVGYFTETNDQAELIQDFKRASNPVLMFYEETVLPTLPAEIMNKQLYSDYKVWCVENGYKTLSSNWFHREFKSVSERFYYSYRTERDRGYRLRQQ